MLKIKVDATYMGYPLFISSARHCGHGVAAKKISSEILTRIKRIRKLNVNIEKWGPDNGFKSVTSVVVINIPKIKVIEIALRKSPENKEFKELLKPSVSMTPPQQRSN